MNEADTALFLQWQNSPEGKSEMALYALMTALDDLSTRAAAKTLRDNPDVVHRAQEKFYNLVRSVSQ